MPLQRFRSLEEAERALWLDSGDPTILARIGALWRLARQLAPHTVPAGVRRFRNIDEAQAERAAWPQVAGREDKSGPADRSQ